MARLTVFVSHLTIEAKFADLIKDRLRQHFIGLLDFFSSSDATSIPVGSQWFGDILTWLRRADLQFIICSKESVQRPWINYEAGAARVRDIEVVPLCHSGITPDQLPVPLSLSEGALLTDAQGLEKLYLKVSAMLGSDVPRVDFRELASDFQHLEQEYGAQRSNATASNHATDELIVENPHVLCVSSSQYLDLGFENQLQLVLDAFPENLRHNRVITSSDLQRVLLTETVHVVHIAAYVCPRTGDMYLSEVELPSGKARSGDIDIVRPGALKKLLQSAGTRLVVIASGDSLALATMLLDVTNVIAPRDIVSAKSMASWVRTFYTALRMKSLSESCDIAAEASHVPMTLLTQRTDMQMRWPTVPARESLPDTR